MSKDPEKFGLKTEERKEGEKPEAIEKKEIELRENSSLNWQYKIDLVLVYLKEKPASWIGCGARFYKTATEREKQEKLNQLNFRREAVKRLLENLSLPNHSLRYETDEEKTTLLSYDFFVGQDLEKLNRLIEAWESGSKKDIGLALGYPGSAVESFIRGEVFDVFDEGKDLKRLSKKEKEELKKEKVFKFLIFAPSKNNWRQELELVRRYQKAIRERSPKIYDEVIKSARGPFVFRGRLKTELERILNKLEYLKRSFRK